MLVTMSTTPAPRASMVGARLGNYELVELLGEGGMGVVYLGRHPQIGKQVAVKVLHPEYAARADAMERCFLEARAVNGINHPNVVDVIDCGVAEIEGHGSVPYLLMEYLDGRPLRVEIAERRIPWARAISIAIEVGRALAAAHDKGIIHRDIKPENIFLVAGDSLDVKVLDFGIAKLVDEAAFGKRLTRSGVVLGTPAYMAPEQFEGGALDGRCDVYALAIVLFEMLTGSTPFPEETIARATWWRMNETPQLPRDIAKQLPTGIPELLARALAPELQERPDMAELVRGLEDPSTVPIRETVAASRRGAVKRTRRRDRRVIVIGALAVTAVLATIAVYTMRETPALQVTEARDPPPPPPKSPPDVVAIEIRSVPDGAEVYVANESAPRGTTPTTLSLVRADHTVEVRLHREGFVDARRAVSALRDGQLEIALAAVARPPVASPARRQIPVRPPTQSPVASPDAGVTALDAAVRPAVGSGDNLIQPSK